MSEAPEKYATDLAACDAIVGEVEAAETEFRAGHPHAARMHLHEAANRARALSVGEEI
jgi:hypothetical protein